MENNERKAAPADIHPAKLVCLSFLSIILFGALLLYLPFAANGASLSLLDALFMATSGVCVTGLSVVDIGTKLSYPGQWILLSLIQIGGLGIMTFSLFFMIFVAQRSFFCNLDVWKFSKQRNMRGLGTALILVLLMTLSFETIGTLLLYPSFRAFNPEETAWFRAIFHSISAFCNAGFSLNPDSFIGYQDDLFVQLTLMGLIITGGLGFVVIDEVRQYLFARARKEPFRFSLHTRVALGMSGLLIAAGTVFIWVFESQNLLKGMPVWQQALNAMFQSVTARTAGFSTLNIGSMSEASLFYLIINMFIGGSPASTAGGIKVTTFAVLLAFFFQQSRGAIHTNILKRQIPREITRKALAISLISVAIVGIGTLLLLLTDAFGSSHAASRGWFMDILFEAFSAFGTVGLSTGITPGLSPFGKVIVIFLMFIGRVGPITLAVALVRKTRETHFQYAEEEVMIG